MKVTNVRTTGILIGQYEDENGFTQELHLTRDGRVLSSQSGLVTCNFSYHSEQSQAYLGGRKMTVAEAITLISENGGTISYEELEKSARYSLSCAIESMARPSFGNYMASHYFYKTWAAEKKMACAV